MPKRILILQMPVIHQGYLDLLEEYKETIEHIFVIDETIAEKCSSYVSAIRPIDSKKTIDILQALGFVNVTLLTEQNIHELNTQPIFLVVDDVSKKLAEKYLPGLDIKWLSVFLKRDRSSVFAEEPLSIDTISNQEVVSMMQCAYEEAKNSSDQWRQVGAVLVRNGNIVLKAYNRGVPSDHTPYQIGDVRDYLDIGERPDLSSTIHAEQQIVAEAAQKGIPLKNTQLFVTHFPCPVCAKLVAAAGINKCYYAEGSSSVEGKLGLDGKNVKVYKVKL